MGIPCGRYQNGTSTCREQGGELLSPISDSVDNHALQCVGQSGLLHLFVISDSENIYQEPHFHKGQNEEYVSDVRGGIAGEADPSFLPFHTMSCPRLFPTQYPLEDGWTGAACGGRQVFVCICTRV